MDAEAAEQVAILATPPGPDWSGRARYAAAMFFHQRGEMEWQTLEIFRYLARLDHEDPVVALRRYRTGLDWAARIAAARAEG